ncbi:hypothetical protein LCL95_04435 [Bacillus timonensis]|nr:hypothetical protein [Bacillus timonensis]
MNEETIAKYYELNEQYKQLDKELKSIKKLINDYFDELVGKSGKGEAVLGQYKVQRQVRTVESFDDEKTIDTLQKLNLNDCIKVIKRPDLEKIEAAITLGLLASKDIEECKETKMSPAIVVRKVT